MHTRDPLTERVKELTRKVRDQERREVPRRFPVNDLATTLMFLPGLKGFWPGSGFQAGRTNDYSGNGLHLLFNGNVQQQSGLTFPRLRMVASADQYLYLDNSFLNYSITNVTNTYHGLTMGMMFYAIGDALGRGLMGKYEATGNQRSYQLYTPASGFPSFAISETGANQQLVTGSSQVPANRWNSIVARYRPSQELSLWLNEDLTTSSTAIYSTIFPSTAEFRIGRYSPGTALDGYVMMAWLCGIWLPDPYIDLIIRQYQRAIQTIS